MKYILLQHADGNDPKQLRIFDTVDARARATREALIGPADDDNKDEPCPELLTLATDGIVHFEGDPSLEWIDAEVSICRGTRRGGPLEGMASRRPVWAGKHCPVRHFSTLTEDKPNTKARGGCPNDQAQRPGSPDAEPT